jgi:rare lipoprotein A (peptidoglycan hydrolase)
LSRSAIQARARQLTPQAQFTMPFRFLKTLVLSAVACGAIGVCAPLQALGARTLRHRSDASLTGGAAPDSPQQPTGRGFALATWFGPGFYGHRTACGQVLQPALIGVANRTLACGTLVEVRYVGRRITLPVVDRGPYGHLGAAWDLTGGAAKVLAISDSVRIRAHVVGRVPNSPKLGLPVVPVALPPWTGQTGPLEAAQAALTGGASAS